MEQNEQYHVESTQVMDSTNSEERTWAMLAHLSTLLNLVTGIMGPVAALIIYLVFKDRSKYIAYQSLQSLIFQIIAWIGGGMFIAVVWLITSILMALIVGFCLVPLAILLTFLPVAAIGYGIYAGVKCSQGSDFKYWLIGDWVRSTYTG